jgi:hypothetical protein
MEMMHDTGGQLHWFSEWAPAPVAKIAIVAVPIARSIKHANSRLSNKFYVAFKRPGGGDGNRSPGLTIAPSRKKVPWLGARANMLAASINHSNDRYRRPTCVT